MKDHVHLQWNCNGIRAKHEEIQRLITELNPTTISLQETKLNENSYIINNEYTVHNKKSPQNPNSGGVAIGIHKKVNYQLLNIQTNLQVIAVKIIDSQQTTICNIYLPPNQTFPYEELSQLIDQLQQPLLILGDFNAHDPLWGDHRTDQRGRLLSDLILKKDLVILNSPEPMYHRLHDNAQSTIDLALTKGRQAHNLTWDKIHDLHGSDHFPIILRMETTQITTYPKQWKLDKANWALFAKELEVDSGQVFTSPQDSYNYITNKITKAANKYIPKTSSKPKKRVNVPWWNKECEVAKKIERSTYKSYKRKPTHTNCLIHKRAVAKKTKVFKEARRNHWRNYVGGLTFQTPSQKVWKKIRKMSGKTPSRTHLTLKTNNKIITEPYEVANMLADYYKSIDLTNAPNVRPASTPRRKEMQTYNTEITTKELIEAIETCKKTSPGPDKIHNIMLKHLPQSMLQLLLLTFNWFWKSGTIPEQWREAHIIPILKPGKDPLSSQSYRPISLTNTLCKTYERIINNRLMWFLENNKLLNPKQFAFQKNRNTIDPIIIFTTDILNGFAQKQLTVATFFDFEKAYDTISRTAIINEAIGLGLSGNLLNFITEFLKQRNFCVRIGETLSDKHYTNNGIPQGSVISVTLFNLGINAVLKNLPANVKGSLYADDLMIYITTNTIRNATRQLQQGIDNINQWITARGLKISKTKTSTVLFKKRMKQNQVLPELFLLNEKINNKPSIKFLGITLDSRLNFKQHIKETVAKAKQSLNILKMVSAHKWGADKSTLLRLYWSLTRSIIDYGANIYAIGNKTTLKELNPVHNTALRLCTGAFRSSPVESLLVEAEEPPLEIRRIEQGMKYYSRINSIPILNQTNITNPDMDETFSTNTNLRRPFGVQIREYINENLVNYNVMSQPIQKPPPWELENISVCLRGSRYSKNALQILQKLCYLEHMENHHKEWSTAYTDGSKTQEGVGFATVLPHKIIKGTLPKETSIFTAELTAILAALQEIKEHPDTTWTINTDSLSAIETIKSTNLKNPIAISIQNQLIELYHKGKTIVLCKVPSHVGIDLNEKADKHAKEATQIPGFYTQKIIMEDLKPIIKKITLKAWQTRWDLHNTKLHEIRPKIERWTRERQLSRGHQVKLSRLRLGHTKFTHEYLMTKTNQPICSLCATPLTITHILIHCPKYSNERNDLNLPSSIKLLLDQNSPIQELMMFLRTIGILDRI